VITMDEILRALIETTNEDEGLDELTAGELE
jgi:hypothetical protein